MKGIAECPKNIFILHRTIASVKETNPPRILRLSPPRNAYCLSLYNHAMYVIAIGWLYVTLLMAATESSLTAGVLTFGMYGIAPLALFLWLLGTPQRRREQLSPKVIDDAIRQKDACDPRADQ